MSKVLNMDLYVLKEVFSEIKNLGTNDFKLPIILAEIEVDKHIEALEKLREPSDKFIEYASERRALLLEHAELDDSGALLLYEKENGGGALKTKSGIPNITRRKKEWEKGISALEKKYSDVLAERQKVEVDFNKTLSKECGLKFEGIDKESIPEMDYNHLRVLVQVGLVKVN